MKPYAGSRPKSQKLGPDSVFIMFKYSDFQSFLDKTFLQYDAARFKSQ